MIKFKTAAYGLLGVCLALQPMPAYALDVRVAAERTIVDRIVDALSDGQLGVDDLVGEAFTEFWGSVGNEIARINICQEAQDAARTGNGRADFHVGVTVAGGGASTTYQQKMRVVAWEDILVIAVVRPDGSFARIWSCGRSYARAPGDNGLTELDGHEALGGAQRFDFATEHGNVIFFLPDDMRAGDTISGTVFVEPAGQTDAERRANAGRLSGYAVEVGGTQARVGQHILNFVVEAGAGGVLIGLIGDGREMARLAPINPATAAVAPPPAFAAPPIAQAGHPLSIQGPFDGHAGNTGATISGQDCPILAESPRQAVVMAPGQPVGQVPLAVTEQGQPALQANISNIVVSLNTPRTELARGERTIVTLRVAGLQGLAAPVMIDLWASASVRLQGGNQQALSIDPQAANAAGEVVRQFNLQVAQAGPFDVTATLRR